MFVILWGLENIYFLVTFITLVYEILLPPLLQSSLRPEGRLCRHIPFETSVWIPEPATGQQASLLWPCCTTTIPSCIREPQRHISHLHWLMEERSSVFPAGQPCFLGLGSGVLPVPCHPSLRSKSAGKFPVARLLYQHPQLYQRTPRGPDSTCTNWRKDTNSQSSDKTPVTRPLHHKTQKNQRLPRCTGSTCMEWRENQCLYL